MSVSFSVEVVVFGNSVIFLEPCVHQVLCGEFVPVRELGKARLLSVIDLWSSR